MSEKRKPEFVLLLKKQGKTNKVEAFNRTLWEPTNGMGKKYRIRVNGKWWPKNEKKFINKTELKELFFRAI